MAPAQPLTLIRSEETPVIVSTSPIGAAADLDHANTARTAIPAIAATIPEKRITIAVRTRSQDEPAAAVIGAGGKDDQKGHETGGPK